MTIAVLLALAAPASAHSSATADQLRVVVTFAGTRDNTVGISPPACQDTAYRLLGGKWNGAYRWSFKVSTTPSSLSESAVISVLQKSFNNITGESNDCGRADAVSATHVYLGTTTRSPSCSQRDGHNVVGFGRLGFGVLAVTCYWINGGKIVEADMKINSRESWALTLAGCRGDMPMLEATVTHEAGHVFGLDHVGEQRHGRLTMSPYIDGPCENTEATLGLGDMLGLEHLY